MINDFCVRTSFSSQNMGLIYWANQHINMHALRQPRSLLHKCHMYVVCSRQNIGLFRDYYTCWKEQMFSRQQKSFRSKLYSPKRGCGVKMSWLHSVSLYSILLLTWLVQESYTESWVQNGRAMLERAKFRKSICIVYTRLKWQRRWMNQVDSRTF